MEEDFDYSIIPGNFIFCLNNGCSRARTCMRYLMAAHEIETSETITVINPKRTAADCDAYFPHEKVNFALGITHLFDNLPHRTALVVKQRIIDRFNNATFYRWKQKVRLISPEEQEAIRRIFRSEGIADEPVYDQQVPQYAWQTSVIKKWR
ncbi:MAG: DUF6078 family protein [Prevotellaceae bacterium]|jgi:hypothetical protein|nr:DUF6078 family protein [Prevotellaceae bacterium]